MTSKQKHLDSIAIDHFKDWKNTEAFCGFASSAGEFGLIELGVDGTGLYAVRERSRGGTTTSFYDSAKKAKKAYKSLLK